MGCFIACSIHNRNFLSITFAVLAKSLAYRFLSFYPFNLSNQYGSAQEDCLNKPDRPISSGLTAKSATGFRHLCVTAIFFVYACLVNVPEYATLCSLTIQHPGGCQHFE